MEDKFVKTCFLERSSRGHQMLFGVLSIMSCATAVNDFLGVLCATFGVSCSTKCSTMWTRNFFVSLLCSIDFQCYTISCPMLRPLSCLTKFCDHNFSLVCRFNLQFSRTVAHFTIFSSPFSSCSILFCIQLCKTHTTRVHMDVFTPIWTLNGDYCSRK